MHENHRNPRTSLRLGLWTAAVLASAFGGSAAAQSASIGADVVSRYVWRGVDFGQSMAVQPSLALGYGGLEAGAWGSYSISASGAEANENDLWIAYTLETASGASFSLGLTDYHFPSPGSDGFRERSAHTAEASLAFSGPESFPLSLFVGLIVDDDKPLYIEAGLPLGAVEGIDLGVHAGMVSAASEFYGTDGAAMVNLGVTAGKDWEITDSFTLPVGVAWVVNLDQDRAHLVFSASFAP